MNDEYFDLATPDPYFSDFVDRPEDQLSGRPLAGKIAIRQFFESIAFFATERQQKGGSENGGTIYENLRERNLTVIGPNVGQYILENAHLFPADLRGKHALAFWGKVYRSSGGHRYVRGLYWGGVKWTWFYKCVDEGDWGWPTHVRAVLLVQRAVSMSLPRADP